MSERPVEAIERRAIGTLILHSSNARKHSAEQVSQIAASIAEWGWTYPVLIDEGDRIIAGHGRVLAARKLGIAEVPVIVARGWTQAQCRAYALADNQLALNASWDATLLKKEVGDLVGFGIDLTLVGFSVEELTELIPGVPEDLSFPESSPPPPDITLGRKQGVYREQYGVIVVCRDEAHQRETFERLTSLGYKPRIVVT
jgi:hypothetical protein